MWARKGRRPLASSRRRYEWGYLYSFVHPDSGEVVSVLGTSVSAAAMATVLAHFAEEAGAGPNKRIVLVIDGAGWHTSEDLVVPEGIHLVFLPPYSPELQPAERLWPLIHEVTANRDFRDMKHLTETVGRRCVELDAERRTVHRLTKYWWWPDDWVPATVA